MHKSFCSIYTVRVLMFYVIYALFICPGVLYLPIGVRWRCRVARTPLWAPFPLHLYR